ncbi:MAG: integron integrase [Smithellaceae bacterium]|nr:integron integrase [Smithellaceae bacterium]
MSLVQTLPEFQHYLLTRKLVPEKNVPYYARWVSRYLVFSNPLENMDGAEMLQRFLDDLQSRQHLENWQVQQAQEAVQLYTTHFPGGITSEVRTRSGNISADRFDPDLVLAKMREAIRIKHYSYSTERSYLDWVKRFFEYRGSVKGGAGGETPGAADIRDFLSHLAVSRQVSASTQNQAFNALLFLFKGVLNIEIGDLNSAVRAKRGPKLPVVLTLEEVRQTFTFMEGTSLLMAQLIYGAGLRLMELFRLRVKDIDFGAGLLLVRAAKGDKDRATILPASIREILRQHLDEVKALHERDVAAGFGEVYLPDALARKYPNAAREWKWQYVFPSAKLSVDPRSGKVRRHHLSEKSIQNNIATAVRKAGIAKHATVHTLRHSFATHLLMNGVNIREIQELLGHKNVETTMIYTHVMRDMANAPTSPLDLLLRNTGAGKGEGSD